MRWMQLLALNRVNLAAPLLPDAVRQAGVHVSQGTAGVLLVVSLFAPDGRYDQLYLSNYASLRIKDELARVPGVGEVSLIGNSDYGLRVRLDPDRLAARNLDAGDVTRALAEQKGAGPVDPERLADLILKADGEGR